MNIIISDSKQYMNQKDHDKNLDSLELSRISYTDLIQRLTEHGINVDKEKSSIKMQSYMCSKTLTAQNKPHSYFIVTDNFELSVEKFRHSTVQKDLSVSYQKGIEFTYESNTMTSKRQLTHLMNNLRQIENIIDTIYNPLYDVTKVSV